MSSPTTVWEWRLLGDLLNDGQIVLGRGDVISRIDIENYPGDYPIYSSSASATGMFGRYRRFMFDEELITWSIDGGGKPFYRPRHKFSVTNVCGFLKIKDAQKWDYRFVAASMREQHTTLTFDWLLKAHPSVIRDLYRLPSIPLVEQRRIADILSILDDQIRTTERIIAKLDLAKRGLVADLIPDLEQIESIPRWRRVSLSDVTSKIQDGTHFSPSTTTGPRMYVTSRNIRMGYLDLANVAHISEAEHRKIYKTCAVRKGDILLTKDGANTGNVCINDSDEEFSLLSSVALIRPDISTLNGDFLQAYLAFDQTQKRLTDAMSGNAITRLTLKKIKAFELGVPEMPVQLRIAEMVTSFDQRIRAEAEVVESLLKLRQGLMTDLLTGRVRVPLDTTS